MLVSATGSVVGIVGLIIAIVVILISLFALIASRYKKCPSDKIMVIYSRRRKFCYAVFSGVQLFGLDAHFY